MRPTRWIPALLAAIVAVWCASAVPATGHPAVRAGSTWRCTTSNAQGECGPYPSYRPITGTTSQTRIGNNVWSPISGWRQTLRADNPGHWEVTAKLARGNTSVVSYPSIGANYGLTTNEPSPLRTFTHIRSRFAERMNATQGTSGWAAYDIWLGKTGCSNCATHEVMIQHDFANNGACTTVGRASFVGSRGVPQRWHLCKYGAELIWKLGRSERHKRSERAGAVSILAMLRWLIRHRYLPRDIGLWQIGYGWEICSTGGQRETFRVTAFSLHVAK